MSLRTGSAGAKRSRGAAGADQLAPGGGKRAREGDGDDQGPDAANWAAWSALLNDEKVRRRKQRALIPTHARCALAGVLWCINNMAKGPGAGCGLRAAGCGQWDGGCWLWVA